MGMLRRCFAVVLVVGVLQVFGATQAQAAPGCLATAEGPWRDSFGIGYENIKGWLVSGCDIRMTAITLAVQLNEENQFAGVHYMKQSPESENTTTSTNNKFAFVYSNNGMCLVGGNPIDYTSGKWSVSGSSTWAEYPNYVYGSRSSTTNPMWVCT